MPDTDAFSFLPARLDQWEEISALEAASYPSDEAATPEKIRHRLEHAAAFFYLLRSKQASGDLVGFINGTCTTHSTIHHDSMSTHEPSGRSLVIHSVVIAPPFRRQKLAVHMLSLYLQTLHKNSLCDQVLLLSKAALLPLYLQCGFQVRRLSPVQHGEDKWFELGLHLRHHFGLDQFIVDAFTLPDRPFSGNPAAVVLLPPHNNNNNYYNTREGERWMQGLAAENNLSETAFVEKVSAGNYNLRWFTPRQEVALCGHATLAAAHVLLYEAAGGGETAAEADRPLLSFHTRHSGCLLAFGEKDGSLSLDFPATPPRATEFSLEEKNALFTALRLSGEEEVVYSGRTVYDALVELVPQAFARLLDLQIDPSGLAVLGGRGVIVTSRIVNEEEEEDKRVSEGCFIQSRCFFPAVGVPEDPVTGSAHCALAPYWWDKLNLSPGEAELKALQASPRGGVVRLRLSRERDRVCLAGDCRTVLAARLYSSPSSPRPGGM